MYGLSSQIYQDRGICDACGRDTQDMPHIMAMVYDMPVRVCHSTCLIDLARVWAPTTYHQHRWSTFLKYSLGVFLLGMVIAI
jgi:hypothetical protein